MAAWHPAITNPLPIISAVPTCSDEGKINIIDVQTSLLTHIGDWEQVPVLTQENVHIFPNGSLVRYTGMVQDMLNPEYFVGSFQRLDGSWASAHFQDQAGETMPHGAATRIAERRPLFFVTPPGLAPWAAPLPSRIPALSASHSNGSSGKRARADDAPVEEDQEGRCPNVPATGGPHASPGSGTSAGAPGSAAGGKSAERGGVVTAKGFMVYVTGTDKVPCLNEIVTVVGVLSIVPDLAADHCAQEDDMMDDELVGANPPTSCCPRLHAVWTGTCPASPAPMALDVESARLRTLGLLSLVLGGDALAAEYLLLQLVGRVHARREDAGVIGLGSLNLTHAPLGSPTGDASLSSLGQALALVIQALATRSVALGLTTAQLTLCPWWPRRDQNSQRLLPGKLQLAKGTQVVLDETVMAAGTLTEVGLRNLQAVDNLIRTQKVAYDFEYFSLDQEADAPVTILSCGRSILKDAMATSLPLAPVAPLGEPESLASLLTSSSLEPLRSYLEAVRQLEFSIPAATAAAVETDLARARQKDASLTPAALHHQLNVARLLAVSHGESELTKTRWAAALALEEQRSRRSAAAVGGAAA